MIQFPKSSPGKSPAIIGGLGDLECYESNLRNSLRDGRCLASSVCCGGEVWGSVRYDLKNTMCLIFKKSSQWMNDILSVLSLKTLFPYLEHACPNPCTGHFLKQLQKSSLKSVFSCTVMVALVSWIDSEPLPLMVIFEFGLGRYEVAVFTVCIPNHTLSRHTRGLPELFQKRERMME